MTSLCTKRKFINLLTILLLSPAALAASHSCTDCHTSDTPAASDLKQSLSALCVDCHQARVAAGEHQVDITATLTGNISLPLQNGKMTCITCHDPHGTSLALRMTDPELCTQCHKR